MATVTIIVPVHNSEPYLVECLESLVSQTLDSIEIICVNDGSTDSSEAILKEYAAKDSRITVINQQCRGVSSARNRGISSSRGEYVLFVDADDCISHRACEYLASVAERSKADIVVFGGKTFPTLQWADESFSQNDNTYTGDDVLYALFHEAGSRPFACNKLYAKSLFSDPSTRFNEELRIGEDHEFQFEVFPASGKVVFVKDELYFYRIRSSSTVGLVADKVDERITAHVMLVEQVIDAWTDKGLTSKYATSLVSWFVDFLFRDFCKCSYNLRRVVSNQINRFASKFVDENVLQELDERTIQKLDTLVSADAALQKPPLVTFVVSSQFGETISLDCLQSILGQTEQCLECYVDVPYASESANEAMTKDARCHQLQVDSLSRILDCVRGEYIIFCPGNALFEFDAMERLLSRVNCRQEKRREPLDIVIYRDSSHVFPEIDPLCFIKPDPSNVEDLPRSVSVSRFGFSMYPVIGLLPVNKVFRADALRCAPTSEDSDELPLVCSLVKRLKFFDKICFIDEAIMSLEPMHIAALDSGESLISRTLHGLFDEMDYEKRAYASDGEAISHLDCALVDLCIELTRQLGSVDDFSFVSRFMKTELEKCSDSRTNEMLSKDQAEYVELLLSGASQNCYIRQQAIRVEKLIASERELNERVYKNSSWALDSEARARGYRDLWVSLSSSRSYKLGAMMTKPIRMLINAIKRS